MAPTNEPRPCRRCGYRTVIYSRCGVPRHFDCTPDTAAGRVAPAKRGDDEQITLRAALADRLDGAGLNRAVNWWNATMRGLPYTGPHTTALRILNGVFSWPTVPTPPPWNPEWLKPLETGPMWQARHWLIPDAVPSYIQGGTGLAAFDVNGMYLSALDIDLPTGPPEHSTWPADDVLRLPGYVRTTGLQTAPYGILSRWEEGMWMTTALARYLFDDGHEFVIPEALVWTTHRRWLGPHAALLRKARMTLLEAAAGDPAARAVLTLLKAVYTRMVGLVGSAKYNGSGVGFNEAWHDQIPGVGQARMFRGLDKVRHQPTGVMTPVIGIHADAAWFVLPPAMDYPVGLEISGQLGKWKLGRRDDGSPQRVEWTPDLWDAYQAGDHTAIRIALSPRVPVPA